MNSENTLPVAPETLDGWASLHEFYRFDWAAWKKVSPKDQEKIVAEATEVFGKLKTCQRTFWHVCHDRSQS